jgi:hypothetical protein
LVEASTSWADALDHGLVLEVARDHEEELVGHLVAGIFEAEALHGLDHGRRDLGHVLAVGGGYAELDLDHLQLEALLVVDRRDGDAFVDEFQRAVPQQLAPALDRADGEAEFHELRVGDLRMRGIAGDERADEADVLLEGGRLALLEGLDLLPRRPDVVPFLRRRRELGGLEQGRP